MVQETSPGFSLCTWLSGPETTPWLLESCLLTPIVSIDSYRVSTLRILSNSAEGEEEPQLPVQSLPEAAHLEESVFLQLIPSLGEATWNRGIPFDATLSLLSPWNLISKRYSPFENSWNYSDREQSGNRPPTHPRNNLSVKQLH